MAFLAACSKEGAAGAAGAATASPGAGAAKPPVMSAPPATTRGTEEGPASSNLPAVSPGATPPKAAAGAGIAPAGRLAPGPSAPTTPRYFVLGSTGATLLPADFTLGALERLPATDPDRAGLVATAQAFLDGLVAGKLRLDLALPNRKDLLGALCSDLVGEEARFRISSWRLGAFSVAADEALASVSLSAPVRDPSGAGALPPRADGELRLRLADGAWRLEDISFDASDLAVDRPRPESPFEPSPTIGTPPPKGE